MTKNEELSEKQTQLFEYMRDPEKRKLAFDAWEKEFGEILADPQSGPKCYRELSEIVQKSDNPEIAREFEHRFLNLLPKIKEDISVQVLNGLEEALLK